MARRIRTLKPEILEDSKTAKLSDGAWRLFVSGITLSDDFGVLRADPHLLAGVVFWGNKDSQKRIENYIRELSDADLWITYEVDGQSYAQVCGWDKHQKVDKPNEKNRLPTPEMAIRENSRDPSTPVEKIRDGVAKILATPPPPCEKSRVGPGKERKGKEGKGKEVAEPFLSPAKPGDAIPLGLAQYLLDAIYTHTPTFKADEKKLTGWANDLRLAISRDGRTPEAIRGVIDFAHRSSAGAFWRPNVLSGRKVREKFDQLEIQLRRPNGRQTRDESIDAVRQWVGVSNE